MYDCQHLAHPFLHDPGVSQTGRALKALLPENIQVDGRKTADLLNYFSELSRQINYYNPDLSISDWAPFFDNNLPFLLSQMAAYPLQVQEQKLSSYVRMLEQNTTPGGLQLLLFYSYYTAVLPLQRWAVRLEGTGVDLETSLNKQIKENLQQPLLSFMSLANTASHCYGVRKIDFTDFLNTPAWGLEQADLYAYQGGFVCSAGGTRSQILSLWDSVNAALPFFTGVIGQVSGGAADDVNNKLQALLTLDGKQDLPPHLALLFSFITVFGKLQSDLNVYSKKHLQFFYTRVLRLKPAPAVPDKAHLVFSIQQQFTQYALDQGLLVKDGKDNNKADILFGLDETLVVNQAKITDTRTLFLNNLNHYDQVYTEGVYMAPNSQMADGLTKPFADPATASWSTLGSQLSKYVPTGDAGPIPYPAARLGFILHSPVLLLNEGLRTITITLACNYDAGICVDALPGELGMADLLPGLQTLLGQTFFYFTQDNLAAALGNGLDPALGQKIAGFLTKIVPDCYGTHTVSLYDASVNSSSLGTDADAVAVFFPLRSVFQFQFSGAEGWVVPAPKPAPAPVVTLTPGVGTEFSVVFTVTLDATLPAVTFFDKKVFHVDYQTTDPLVMVLLDDTIKIPYTSPELNPDCCLEPVAATNELLVSTYHFFKHVQIISNAAGADTSIVTDVCGLKNFIVQNDQSVMDVNSPVYPFGTRPTIIDFDVVIVNDPFAPAKPNLRGPNFYIGSAEIFCKAWTAVWIGINWKDKPSDFHEYYAGYVRTGPGNAVTDYGLDQNNFEVSVSALSNGGWTKERSDNIANSGFIVDLIPPAGLDFNRKLFDNEADGLPLACTGVGNYDYSFYVRPKDFPITPRFSGFPTLTKYNADTREGFIRFTLEKQDFLHKDYSYVLARQMIAFGKLPSAIVSGAVYYSTLFGYYVVDSAALYKDYTDLEGLSDDIVTRVGIIEAEASGLINSVIGGGSANNIRLQLGNFPSLNPPPPNPITGGLVPEADELHTTVKAGVKALNDPNNPLANPSAVIPKEPWTPIIQNMVIHYSAKATMTDMGLIHLYPYDGTYEIVDIESTPSMLPVFCAEGLLFLGIQNLLPGENLNILFQLAEATADSEDAPDLVNWEYLANNQWAPLAPDFQVIEDATQNLTRSGIIELSIPRDITSTNTVMPAGLWWLRASVPSHTPGVSETLALFTQAVQATFIPNPGDATTATAANDLTRLSAPLAAGSLAKLNTANGAVTGIQQPYTSFGGQAPESTGNPFFIRISELLRHKGRGIQKWDYERLVLQNYPQVLRAKCINHSYFLNAHQYLYDFPMAPGNVMVAVIPDVSQLVSADSLQPRVPMAILEDIRGWLAGIISPFIQLFVVNPRYEPIDFCLELVLVRGMDEDFYQQQAKKDLTEYLAPWLTDEMDRFAFGLPLYRSDVIRFLESLDYIDYLLDLEMTHQGDPMPDKNNPPEGLEPLTPRSILIAGDITVYIPDPVPGAGQPPMPDCGNMPIPVSDHCTPPIKKALSLK